MVKNAPAKEAGLRPNHSISYELARRLRSNYDSGQYGGLENRRDALPAVTI